VNNCHYKRKKKESKKRKEGEDTVADFLLGFLFDPENGSDFSSELHGVTTQKNVLFIVTAVRISDPTQLTVLVLRQVRPMFVTLLKFIYVSLEASDILVMTLCFKLIDFVLQIFPLFPELSGLHVLNCSDYLQSFGSDPVTTAITLLSFGLITILNILLRQTNKKINKKMKTLRKLGAARNLQGPNINN
jgi:hypothetical protein